MRIYIARPISGCSYEEVVQYYQTTADRLRAIGYEVFHAMCAKTYLQSEKDFKAEGYEFPLSTDHAIVERDRWMTEMADIIFVNLSDCKRVSIGTMFEMAWAHQLGKHSVVVMEKDNIHRHSFVLEASDVLYETYSEALDYLEKLSGNKL